jgi:hypothetical protein
LINPYQWADRLFNSGNSGEIFVARMLMMGFSLAATAGYAAVVYAMYVSMVKNFDMTIRRQSR